MYVLLCYKRILSYKNIQYIRYFLIGILILSDKDTWLRFLSNKTGKLWKICGNCVMSFWYYFSLKLIHCTKYTTGHLGWWIRLFCTSFCDLWVSVTTEGYVIDKPLELLFLSCSSSSCHVTSQGTRSITE